MHRQIPVIGILLIVQGVLECLMGLLYGLAALVFPSMLEWMNQLAQQQPAAKGAAAPPQFPDELATFFVVIYVSMGVLTFVVGLFRIIVGSYNIRYRGRVAGIIALFMGALTFITCYCAPTSLGLMIYGLIVYFNGQSAQAFALSAEGKSSHELNEIITRSSMPRYPEDPRGDVRDDEWRR